MIMLLLKNKFFRTFAQEIALALALFAFKKFMEKYQQSNKQKDRTETQNIQIP